MNSKKKLGAYEIAHLCIEALDHSILRSVHTQALEGHLNDIPTNT